MDRVEVVVVGAGVVGLAIARSLAKAGHEVLILEREAAFGQGISARNSEVIHAGIYYPKDSLKAQFCVRGKALLYDFCVKRGVPHKQIGKWIVACDEAQQSELESIRRRALDNGVEDLQFVDQREAGNLEPELKCFGALRSPSTGIVDVHALMLALLGEAEDAGAALVTRTTLKSAESTVEDSGWKLSLDSSGIESQLACRWLINSAGLDAAALAKKLSELPESQVPETRFARGNYFLLQGRAPFSKLIYPVPEAGGLGTHLTLDLGGQARFGPDVQWTDQLNYQLDLDRMPQFYQNVRRFWPGLPDDALIPGYVGIRPKIFSAGAPITDFVISDPGQHHCNGLINLFGIESPGLTSSLAIAEDVCKRVTSIDS